MELCSGEQGLSWTETLMPKPSQPTRRNQQQQQSADQQRLECPRCKSTNTKFCYYNNYNKSQPRHYCKGCKRHWTKGGTLRNVPVGGGRKNKKFKPSSHATITTTTTTNTNMAKTLFGTIPSSSTFQQNGTVNGVSAGSLRLFPGSENGKFFFSSGGSLDNMVSSSTTISNQHKDHGYGCSKNQDTSLESTITTSSSIFSHDQPWQGPSSTSGGAMEVLPSYWNWNDIETLISADLDTTWDDDLEIKF